LDSSEGGLYVAGVMLDLDHFIADCRAAVGGPRPAALIRALVARAVGRPADVERALGAPREGGLFPLHHSPELTIVNVVWTPGMAIYPHEHGMWAVIGLYGGREENTFYRRTAAGLAVAGGKVLAAGETMRLDEAVIHAVANPLRAFSGAIHVYGGDFFGTPRSEWTPDTLEERPFDSARARQVYALANARWRRETEAGP
jgi:predicted metal-dependent enzyme (double-stranded beta helix superfamily)